jgi:hypothetical protein
MTSGVEGSRLYASSARARTQRQDPSAAERAARAGLEARPSAAACAELLEILGLALSYQGRAGEAEAAFVEALARSAGEGSPRERCRLLGQARPSSHFVPAASGLAVEGHAEAVFDRRTPRARRPARRQLA